MPKGKITIAFDGEHFYDIPADGTRVAVRVPHTHGVTITGVRITDIRLDGGRAPLPPTWERTLTFREQVLAMLDIPPHYTTTQDIKDAFPEVSHDKVRETLVLLEQEGLAHRIKMKGHRPGRAHEHWYRV